MGTAKPFVDGGGLCSPGRWKPSDRRVLDYGLNKVRNLMYERFMRVVADENGNATTPIDFAMRIAVGRYEDSPFEQADLDEARRELAHCLGFTEDVLQVPHGQVLHLDLIAKLLKLVGDPDWSFFLTLKEGVNLGVDQVMDRTPEVFEEKTHWKLEGVEVPGEVEKVNYKMLEPHKDEVRALFVEESRLGWMKEITDEEAKREYGEKLFVAALAVVQEPGKIRVVHDGSNGVHVNHRIRPRDQTRSPGAGELRTILREKAMTRKKMFMIAGGREQRAPPHQGPEEGLGLPGLSP